MQHQVLVILILNRKRIIEVEPNPTSMIVQPQIHTTVDYHFYQWEQSTALQEEETGFHLLALVAITLRQKGRRISKGQALKLLLDHLEAQPLTFLQTQEPVDPPTLILKHG